MQKYSTRFDGLVPSTSYMIHISTELDGKTVVQTKQQFKTLKQNTKEQTEQNMWFKSPNFLAAMIILGSDIKHRNK